MWWSVLFRASSLQSDLGSNPGSATYYVTLGKLLEICIP